MLTRRRFLAQSALATAALGTTTAQTPATVEATTPLGKLRGTLEDNVRCFRGIRYAQPPVGPLRFHPPQPPEAWTGVRDATHYASIAMQFGNKNVPQSEDCLYLNVWAPNSPGPHPVFVWIHGGGFVGGSSFGGVIDGPNFAHSDVVCVSIAYRLGVFGFLDLEPILGNAYTGSADNSLRDTMAALHWVRENIAAFGGDPHRVTVGGESAGAKLTDVLLGTPSAAPLFHQAISESGGADRVSTPQDAANTCLGFAKLFTEMTQQPPAKILAAPATQLIEVQTSFMKSWPKHFPLRPQAISSGTSHADAVLPRMPLLSIRSGASKGKRLLLGTNRDESALFLGPHPEHDPTAKDLGNLSLAQFTPIEAAYRKLFPQLTPEQLRIRMVTAEEYWVPSMRVVEAQAPNGETFVYRLDEKVPGGRFKDFTPHAYDLRFVWDRLASDASAAERTIATQMHAAWVSFIAGKAPSAPGLPTWSPWTAQHPAVMLLNTPSSQLALAPSAAELQLWDGQLEG